MYYCTFTTMGDIGNNESHVETEMRAYLASLL